MRHAQLPGIADPVESTVQGLGARTQEQRDLKQWMTPTWFAQAFIERYFPDLDENDRVIDACCGTGAFIGSLPAYVPALGIELDPKLAQIARETTGRTIHVGDFLKIDVAVAPSVIISNPPFDVDFIHNMLDRAYRLFAQNSETRGAGRIGCLLPAYFLQTAQRIVPLMDRWSINVEMTPRNVFPNLRAPLAIVIFSKDGKRQLVGLALYREADEVLQLPKHVQDTLRNARGSAWLQVVLDAIKAHGGTATIQQIYDHVQGRVNTKTAFVRPKVRQQCQMYCPKVARGTYALPVAA